MRGHGLELRQRRFRQGSKEDFFHGKTGLALERAARRGGGVTVPGVVSVDVAHGLTNAMLGHSLDPMIPEVFPNLILLNTSDKDF